MVESSEFPVRTSTGQYSVGVGEGQFVAALQRARVVLVDEALADRLLKFAGPVVTMRADEDTKTLAGCEQIIGDLRSLGVRRGDHLVAVGGGVVQDVATFVADIYMRGLPWSYVPTTLMAMADSCIGGKSSINVAGVKNLVGGIYPPSGVFVDPSFLATLDGTAVAAGLSEAAKIAYCRGPESFATYLECFAGFGADPTLLIDHVLRAKRWFVEIDEHDAKERRLLNFGHTFGHALESAVEHALPHGLAVAVGVLCASAHPASAQGASTQLLDEHCRQLLRMSDMVPAALARFDPTLFERAFRSDKKHAEGTFRLILPAPGGGVAEVGITAGTDAMDTILRVTQNVLDSIRSDR